MKLKLRTFSSFIFIFLLAGFPAALAASDPRAVRIIEEFEGKLNLEGFDVTNLFTLIQKKEGEADRVLRVRVYRRDATQAFTLLFEYPDSEKGKGYLRKGDDLFLYLPTTREFVYRNRKDDVGSTDVRTDLFGRLTNLERFDASYIGVEKVSQWDCDVIRLKAKVPDVSFPIQRWYVRKEDGLPVKVENFSASETLLRTYYYVSYQNVARGKFIFNRLLAVNHLEKGQRTFLTNEDISTTPIRDYTFTKAFLEEQSR